MSDVAFAGVGGRRVAPLTATTAAPRRAFAAEVLPGAEAYDTLRADWDDLVRLQPGAILFQTPAVLATWARHFTSDSALPVTVVLRSEGRAILIWPLLIERRGFVTVASGAGTPIGQYDDFLLAPGADAKAALAGALDVLRKTHQPDLVVLERVRTDSALRSALGDRSPYCGGDAAPYVDLSHGVAAVLANRKSSTVKHQRNRMNRFAQSGSGGFMLARDPIEAEAWMLEALALKRDWLHDTGRLSRAFIKQATGFCLTDLARTLTRPDTSPTIVVSRLSVDMRTAAIEVGFWHHSNYHLYLRAFSPKFSKLGPGNILTQRILEWCAEQGIQRYDMLAPRSRNKSEWQTDEVGVFDYVLPMTLRGRLYAEAVLKRLEPGMRDAFYLLPEKLRSAVAGLALRL